MVINSKMFKNGNFYNKLNFYSYTSLTLLNSTFDLNFDFYYTNNTGNSKNIIFMNSLFIYYYVHR